MRTFVALAATILLASCDSRRTASGAIEVGECHVGGCFSELCSDQAGVTSVCEWRPEQACYRTATCAPQEDGSCGWTQSAELTACLANGGPAERACSFDQNCPSGQVCEDCGTGGVCALGCRQDWQCPLGTRCRVVQCIRCPCPRMCG